MRTNASTELVGSLAPSFTLPGLAGAVDPASYRGRSNLVLYFVREFHCPLCQRHAARLGRLAPRLTALGTEVVVIGPAHRDQAERMANRFKLPFPVAVDPDRSVYASYGFGKGLLGIQRSGTVLVDRAGRVRYHRVGTNPATSLDESELIAEIERLAADDAAGRLAA